MAIAIALHAPEGRPIPAALIERGVRLACGGEGCEEGEISLTFMEDAPILELNRKWLGHDWVPDVLSFPFEAVSDAGPSALGDLYIGLDQATRQAEEHGVPVEEELLRLAVHGTLHILGYDHSEAEAESGQGAQFLRQEEIVRAALREEESGR